MTTMIKDLPRNEAMDSNDMAAVEGGRAKIRGQNLAFGQSIAVGSLGGELLDNTSDDSDDRLNPNGL